ncbi:hypothetical protein D3Z36_16085 [Lachnospiraceae bacterium]|nr:hypothetical protein [Lachnospiraceae bacterium]
MRKKLAWLLALCVTVGMVNAPIGIWEVQAVETQEKETESTEEETPDVSEYSYEKLPSGGEGLLITKYNGNATEITIPSEINGEKVVAIGKDALSGCGSLVSITIPDSVSYIGYYWYVEEYDGIYIGTNEAQAFSSCGRLEEITFSGYNLEYSSSDGILYDGTGSNLIYCPAGRKRNVTIGAEVTRISRGALSDCANLQEILADENNEKYSSVDGILYDKTMTELVCCPRGWKGNLEIGSGVTDIEWDAFSGCSGIEGFIVDGNNAKYSAQDGILYDRGMVTLISCPAGKAGSLSIPEDVIEIRYYAFENCSELRNIKIPKSVVSMNKIDGIMRESENCFYNYGKFEEVIVDEDNENYCSRGGILYSKSLDSLIRCPVGKKGNVTIPKNEQGIAVTIDYNAFRDCTAITSVTAEERIISIGSSAFSDCSSLTSVTAEKGIGKIAASAFRNCSNLVDIGARIGVVGAYGFYNCSSLKDITLSGINDYEWGENEGEEHGIGEYAFNNCVSLENITVQGNIEMIGKYAFDNCNKLSSVTVEECAAINAYAFRGCTNLVDLTIWSCRTIKETAFDDCKERLNIHCLKGSEAELYARRNGINYVTIPKKVSVVQVSEPSIIKNAGDENFYIEVETNRDELSCESSNEKVVRAWYEGDGMVSVSIRGTGSAQITIIADETSVYDAAQQEIAVTVEPKQEGGKPETGKKAQTITLPESPITKTVGDKEFSLGAKTDGDGTLSYESSNEDVASVSDNGTVSIKGVGTAKITVTASETDNYNMSQKALVITVNPQNGGQQPGGGQKSQTITAKSARKTYGEKDFSLGAKTSGGGQLSYTSSNRKVASIDKNGTVTIKGCGVTKITVRAAAKGQYKAAQKTVTLTVVPQKLKGITAKSAKAKSITVKWKKDSKASGYIIECSTDKNFKKNVKKVTVSKNKTVSQKIPRLKAGKKYYVRACAYTVSGKSKIKGAYAKVKKTIKVKK